MWSLVPSAIELKRTLGEVRRHLYKYSVEESIVELPYIITTIAVWEGDILQFARSKLR